MGCWVRHGDTFASGRRGLGVLTGGGERSSGSRVRGLGVALVVLFAGLVMIGVVPAVAWGAGWSVVPSANALAPQGEQSAVSCASASACTAVGDAYNSGGTRVTLAERWNGTSWAIQTTPNASGAQRTVLSGVSCTTASACTAVGYYDNSAGAQVTLAERWNGTSWAIQTTPNPLRRYNQRAVAGVVHGGERVHRRRLLHQQRGHRGDVGGALERDQLGDPDATPNPAGRQSSGLLGVSCTTASACTAVGYYENSAGTLVTLAERWNGTSWAIQATPNLTGATESQLQGVSCTSASACTAVGYCINSAGTGVMLAERWNGTSWAIDATPSPSGAKSSGLSGVSCTSASACIAVGNYTNSAGTEVTLAERWNGTSWATQTTPNPSGAQYSGLSGVSCTTASACTAVGNYTNSASIEVTLAERWNGTSWAIQTTPNPSGAQYSGLSGMSCTTASACTAVGYYYNGAGIEVMLAERWNGTSWATQTTPNPSGAEYSGLSGVSCTTASACTAVGYYDNSAGTGVTLAERWNGTIWAIQTTPTLPALNPAGCRGCRARRRARASPSAHYTNSSGTAVTLAERWNGTSWVTQTTPNPSGATYSALSGVSCTTASACTAVGYSYNSAGEVMVAERWNGTSWATQTTPHPSGAKYSALSGVSCTAASACTAVGNYTNSASTQVTLAERWNGTSWATQTTPNPSGAQYSGLSGVSCTTASACTAIGNYTNSATTEVTLAEHWNGTSWATQATPNPSGAFSSALSEVSCTAASACTAVGYYQISVNTDVTLAERYTASTATAVGPDVGKGRGARLSIGRVRSAAEPKAFVPNGAVTPRSRSIPPRAVPRARRASR